jgi:hypothetical protein
MGRRKMAKKWELAVATNVGKKKPGGRRILWMFLKGPNSQLCRLRKEALRKKEGEEELNSKWRGNQKRAFAQPRDKPNIFLARPIVSHCPEAFALPA